MSVQTFIDDVEVTDVVLDGSVTRRLNRTSQAAVRIPFGASIGVAGSRLKILIDEVLKFHGFIQTISDDGDEDKLYSQYEAADPMEMWKWRPARDGPGGGDPGDFSKPDFFTRVQTGPQIMQEILQQSEDISNPADGEGPLFIDYGTFEGGGLDLSGAPVDWPMTIAEVADLLVSTGEVDIILMPIDSGGNMAEVSVHNGDYGTDRTSEISFDYQTGLFNVAKIRRVEDMSNICNKLWYYLGPRVQTSADPSGEQHWKTNITPDGNYWTNGSLSIPPTAPPVDMNTVYPGAPDILWRSALSRGQYGTRMEVKIFDGDAVAGALPLFQRLWLLETFIRAQPRVLVHVTPIRGFLPNFDIGDLVTVSAGAKVRGGFSGAQRVYEYTTSWDTDGVISLGEIQTSDSQEGA